MSSLHLTPADIALQKVADALVALVRDKDSPIHGKQQFKDPRDIPTSEERIQIEGAASFRSFEKGIEALDKQLRQFPIKFAELGSSMRVILRGEMLRQQLQPFLFVFKENAMNLFPHGMVRPRGHRFDDGGIIEGTGVNKKPRLCDLSQLLNEFATGLNDFRQCLDEYQAVADDDAVKFAIDSFEADIKYWCSCLAEHTDPQLAAAPSEKHDPEIRRYVHELMGEMGNHLDDMATTLITFIDISIPNIRLSQQQRMSYMKNLSTIATFFSGVSATTLQISLGNQTQQNLLGEVVNAFWFCSLVFSIAAVINSLLGFTWNRATYRSPLSRTPWWVLIWIQKSPVVFLVLSVACFSAGVVLLPYSTQQRVVTSVVVTILTAFTSLSFAILSTWIVLERLVSIWPPYPGHKCLADVLEEILLCQLQIPVTKHSSGVTPPLTNVPGQITPHCSIDMSHPNSNNAAAAVNHGDEQAALSSPLIGPSERQHWLGSPALGTPSLARSRLQQLVRKAIQEQRRQRFIEDYKKLSEDRRKAIIDDYKRYKSVSRAASLKSKLKTLNPSDLIYDHGALVRFLQFSPDGKFLATSSWDQTCAILPVGEQIPFKPSCILLHPQRSVEQIAWSPDSKFLLTKLKTSIKVWKAEDGLCQTTIERKCDVQSITWFPSGGVFLSIEGNSAIKLDLDGKRMTEFRISEKLTLHNVAVTPTGDRILGVATPISTEQDTLLTKSRAEKWLFSKSTE